MMGGHAAGWGGAGQGHAGLRMEWDKWLWLLGVGSFGVMLSRI